MAVGGSGFVYVIGPAEPCEPYRVKIGKAGNAVFRLRELQTGSPFRLEILCVIQADDPARLEREIHFELAEYRCHGEWFELGRDPAGVVKDVVAGLRVTQGRRRSHELAGQGG